MEIDNTPRRLEKVIRDWAKIIRGREIVKSPYKMEEQYEKLWDEIIEKGIGGFERAFGGDMQLAENQTVVPRLEKEFKPDYLAKIKELQAITERDHWRRQEMQRIIDAENAQKKDRPR